MCHDVQATVQLEQSVAHGQLFPLSSLNPNLEIFVNVNVNVNVNVAIERANIHVLFT